MANAQTVAFVTPQTGQWNAVREQIRADGSTSVRSVEPDGIVVQTSRSLEDLKSRFSGVSSVRTSNPASVPVEPDTPVQNPGLPPYSQAVGIIVVPTASPAKYRLAINGSIEATFGDQMEVQSSEVAIGSQAIVEGKVLPSESDHRIVVAGSGKSPVERAQGNVITQVTMDLGEVVPPTFGAEEPPSLMGGERIKPPMEVVLRGNPFDALLLSDESAIRNDRVSPGIMMLSNRHPSASIPSVMKISRANQDAALSELRGIRSVRGINDEGSGTVTFTVDGSDAERLSSITGATFRLDTSRIEQSVLSDLPVATGGSGQGSQGGISTTGSGTTQNGGTDGEPAEARIFSGVSDLAVGGGLMAVGVALLLYASGEENESNG